MRVGRGRPCTEYYAIELVGGPAVDPYGMHGFTAVIAGFSWFDGCNNPACICCLTWPHRCIVVAQFVQGTPHTFDRHEELSSVLHHPVSHSDNFLHQVVGWPQGTFSLGHCPVCICGFPLSAVVVSHCQGRTPQGV